MNIVTLSISTNDEAACDQLPSFGLLLLPRLARHETNTSPTRPRKRQSGTWQVRTVVRRVINSVQPNGHVESAFFPRFRRAFVLDLGPMSAPDGERGTLIGCSVRAKYV